jgi:hypothetical protein
MQALPGYDIRKSIFQGRGCMLILDRALAVLLVLGSAGHTLGSLKFYHDQPDARFWALNGTLVILLVAALRRSSKGSVAANRAERGRQRAVCFEFPSEHEYKRSRKIDSLSQRLHTAHL